MAGDGRGTGLTPLRHVDPTRPPSAFARFYAALAATSAARLVSRWVSWKLDPVLLRATGGRVATTLVFPTAVLETVGAKSGARRRNAVIYFHDGERVTIVASNAGSARHPSWYHNLRAHPDVVFGGRVMRATIVRDEAERARLWPLADRVFPTFATIGGMRRRCGVRFRSSSSFREGTREGGPRSSSPSSWPPATSCTA